MITAIELKNWKTHRHSRMEFSQGANIIVGVMGAGKSSILDAMSFALFGTFPALNHKRVSISNLIMSRPKQETKAEVSLEFTAKGSRYKVLRRIDGSSSNAFLEKDGKYMQTQTERVNEEVEKLLEIDYDTFARAVYSEQNGLDYFLSLRKGDRKKQIDAMLGLDRFAAAEENATSLVNTIRSLIADEEQMMSQMDGESIRKRLEELSAEAGKIREESRELEARILQKKETIASLTKEVNEAKEKFSKMNRLTTQVAQLDTRSATLRKEIEKINALSIDENSVKAEKESAQKALEAATSELKLLKDRERALTKEQSEHEARLKMLEKEKAERDKILAYTKDKNLEKVIATIKEQTEELHRASGRVSELKSSILEAEKFEKELKEHIGKCPVCERELDEKMRESILGAKSGLIAAMKKEITGLEAQVPKRKAEIAELTVQQNKLQIASERLSGYKNTDVEYSKHSTLLEEAKRGIKDITEGVRASESAREKLLARVNYVKSKEETLARRKDYEQQVAKIAGEAKVLKDELQAVQIDEKKLYALQESLLRENSGLSETTAKLESDRRYAKSVSDQVESKTKELANLNAMKGRVESRRKVLLNMNKFKTALVEAEASLRNRLVFSINNLMHTIWQEIYPYQDYPDIRLSAKKDDYLLEASTGTEAADWVSVDAVASGGERSIACLSMRIALSMVVVPNLKWIILDEPTHNIDNNGMERMVEVISDSLPKIVEQIFIITHEERLKQIPTAKIYQLSRNKAEHAPTTITEL